MFVWLYLLFLAVTHAARANARRFIHQGVRKRASGLSSSLESSNASSEPSPPPISSSDVPPPINKDRVICMAADVLDLNIPPSAGWDVRMPIVSPKGPSGNLYIAAKDVQITSLVGLLRIRSDPSTPGTFTYSLDSNEQDGKAKVTLKSKMKIVSPPGLLGSLMNLFVGDPDLDVTAWVQYEGKTFLGEDGKWTFVNKVESASVDLGRGWFSLFSLIQQIINMWGGLDKIIFEQMQGIIEMFIPPEQGDTAQAESSKRLDLDDVSLQAAETREALEDLAKSVDFNGIALEYMFDIRGSQRTPESDLSLDIQADMKALIEVSSFWDYMSSDGFMKKLIGNASSTVFFEKVQSLGSEFDALSGMTFHLDLAAKRKKFEERKAVAGRLVIHPEDEAASDAGKRWEEGGFDLTVSGPEHNYVEERCMNSNKASNERPASSFSEVSCTDSEGLISSISLAYLSKARGGPSCSGAMDSSDAENDAFTVLKHTAEFQKTVVADIERSASAAQKSVRQVLKDLLSANVATAKLLHLEGIQDVEIALEAAISIALTSTDESISKGASWPLVAALRNSALWIEHFLEANDKSCTSLDITEQLRALCTGAKSCKLPSNYLRSLMPQGWQQKCLLPPHTKEELFIRWTCRRTHVSSAWRSPKSNEGKFQVVSISSLGLPRIQVESFKSPKILEFVHDDPKVLGFIGGQKSKVKHGVMFRFIVAQSGMYSLKFRAAFFTKSGPLGEIKLAARLVNSSKWLSNPRSHGKNADDEDGSSLYRGLRNFTMRATQEPTLSVVDVFESLHFRVGEHFIEIVALDQQTDLRNHRFFLHSLYRQTDRLDGYDVNKQLNVALPTSVLNLLQRPEAFTGHSEIGGVAFQAKGVQKLRASEEAYQYCLKDAMEPNREKLGRKGSFSAADGPVPAEFTRQNSRDAKAADLSSLFKFDVRQRFHADIMHTKMSHRPVAQPLLVVDVPLSIHLDLNFKKLLQSVANPSGDRDFGYVYMQSANWAKGGWPNFALYVHAFYIMNCGVVKAYNIHAAVGKRWADRSYKIEELGPLSVSSIAGKKPAETLSCVSEDVKGLKICNPSGDVISKWKRAIEAQIERFQDPRAKQWLYGTHNQTLSVNLPLKPSGVSIKDPSQDFLAASQETIEGSAL